MLLPRSISVRRYAVTGKVPDPASEDLAAALARGAFVPLGADSPEDESAGWTGFDNFLDTAPDVATSFAHGVLRLSLRMDKRVIPAGLVRAHVALERKALVAAGERKPTKRQLDELRQGVLDMLRPQAQPKTTVVRGLWDFKGKMLYLLTTAQTPAERFAVFFASAFGDRRLVQLEPPALVAHLAATKDRVSQLDTLEPADLRLPADRRTTRRAVSAEEA